MSTNVVITPPEVPPLRLPRALAQLTARLLAPADADTVLALRKNVLSTMPATLRAVDPARGLMPDVAQAWATKHLGPRARTLAVFDGETLIAFASLLMADAHDPEDPGHLLQLSDHDWQRSAHMAACMVHEDYRGLHLQTKLLNWRRQFAETLDRTLLLGMTACGNTYSRRNMMGAGMGIRWVGEWRPGSWWYALSMDLIPDAALPHDNRHEWVALNDRMRQRDLIAMGYVGVAETPLHTMERRKETRLQFVSCGPASGPGARPSHVANFSTECVQ